MTGQHVTFMNVIEVDPERSEEVTTLLRDGFDTVMRHRKGFVSGSVLASLDGTHIISQATWQRVEDIEATRTDPAAADYARRLAQLATATPRVYRTVAEIGREKSW
jgi:hypothetical protein